MLKQKAIGYNTKIIEVDRFFPSSKLCSNCGQLKQDLKLDDRIYECDCGLRIDRDLNAAINLRNCAESAKPEHGEIVRPSKLNFNFKGCFDEVLTQSLEKDTFL